MPWRRARQPTSVFLPGESHGQGNLVATVHRVAKSWTQPKWLSMHPHLSVWIHVYLFHSLGCNLLLLLFLFLLPVSQFWVLGSSSRLTPVAFQCLSTPCHYFFVSASYSNFWYYMVFQAYFVFSLLHHWNWLVLQGVLIGFIGVKVKVTQSCPTLQPHGQYSPWNSPGQNTRVGSLSLLQGIFPTQGLNPGLLHCWWILYQLNTREGQEYWSG